VRISTATSETGSAIDLPCLWNQGPGPGNRYSISTNQVDATTFARSKETTSGRDKWRKACSDYRSQLVAEG